MLMPRLPFRGARPKPPWPCRRRRRPAHARASRASDGRGSPPRRCDHHGDMAARRDEAGDEADEDGGEGEVGAEAAGIADERADDGAEPGEEHPVDPEYRAGPEEIGQRQPPRRGPALGERPVLVSEDVEAEEPRPDRHVPDLRRERGGHQHVAGIDEHGGEDDPGDRHGAGPHLDGGELRAPCENEPGGERHREGRQPLAGGDGPVEQRERHGRDHGGGELGDAVAPFGKGARGRIGGSVSHGSSLPEAAVALLNEMDPCWCPHAAARFSATARR